MSYGGAPYCAKVPLPCAPARVCASVGGVAVRASAHASAIVTAYCFAAVVIVRPSLWSRRPARAPTALEWFDRNPDQKPSLPKSRRICSRTLASGSWPMLLPPTTTSLGAAVAAWVKIGATSAVARATVAIRVFMLRLLATDVGPSGGASAEGRSGQRLLTCQMPPGRVPRV